MTQEPQITPEFHLNELEGWIEGLVAALAEVGIGGPRLREILALQVQARCVDCGAVASGEEISEALALAEASDAPASIHPPTATPRQRLADHRCLRPECTSRYYQLILSPAGVVSWKPVVERAQQLRAARTVLSKGERESEAEERRITRRQTILGSLLVLIGLASLWTVRHWWQTGAFPGSRPPRKYKVDPRSLPPTAGDR
ncbi:MAG: hypothetical protein JNK85_22350 [Verrucomicrobiales bacterium]|nr:hypothetical protein [Verrucomicrobiales bacterium]